MVRGYDGDSLVLETGATSSFEKQAPTDVHLIGLGDASDSPRPAVDPIL